MDKKTTKDIKAAVVSHRKKNEFGPRNRGRLVFRASELGDLVSYRDHKGEPGGCALKVFYSFWPEKFKREELDAEALLNFDKGFVVEDAMKTYLIESGLYVDEQLKLGAWSTNPNAPGFMQADPRWPDRSDGLVRGKADFLIRHPEHGLIPLEYKSTSKYMFDAIKKDGPKGDNSLQIHFYGHQMKSSHVALGYTDKESNDFQIFTAPTQYEMIDEVLKIARRRKKSIMAGKKPLMPKGIKAPQYVNDRGWPCYAYAVKKKRVIACGFFKYCHGDKPTEWRPKNTNKQCVGKTQAGKTCKRKSVNKSKYCNTHKKGE